MKRKLFKYLFTAVITLAMLLQGISPLLAITENETGVTVTIEYIDENGEAKYFLEPTRVSLEDGATALSVLANGYSDLGTVTYSAIKGITVTPNNGEAVGEVNWGKKAWWPFVNGTKVGIKYDVKANDVVRLIYCQDSKNGFPGYLPPSSEGDQGKLTVNKDKLIESMASLSASQIENHQDAYNQALLTAIDINASQEAVNEQYLIINEILQEEIHATDIEISPNEVSLLVGQSQQMTAKLLPDNASDVISWSSENENVAKVTANGLILAVGEGKTIITAQANEKVKKSVEVTVTGIKTESISLNEHNLSLKEGQGIRLKANILPLDTTDKTIWKSNDEKIATVDDTGMVIGKSAGETTIEVISGDQKDICKVLISPRKQATSPTVIFQHDDGRITELDENNTMTLSSLDVGKFVVEGIDDSIKPVWQCKEKNGQSESSIIHISSTGNFYPKLGQREAKVFTKDPDYYESAKEIASFTLNVVETEVTDLKLYLDGIEINSDDLIYLNGTESKVITIKGKKDDIYINIPSQALQADSTEGSYIYSINDKNELEFFAEDQATHTFTVAMIDNANVSCRFMATAKKIAVTALDVVYPEVFYISSWNGLGNQYTGITSHDLNPDSRYEINITPYNATNKNVKWISHNPEIAFYQDAYSNGIVPQKAGTASFTIVSEDNPAATKDITIRFEYKYPLQDVSLKQTNYTLKQYESIDLDLLVTPLNATNQRFNWTYSQEGIVKVDDRVTSNKDGMTTTHTLSALNQGTVTVTGIPLDDTNQVEPIQFTVTVTAPGEAIDLDFNKYVTENISHSLNYLKAGLDNYYQYGMEWNIFTILRAKGSLNPTDLNNYYNSVVNELENSNRILPTDYFRMTITLLAMGKDPTNVEGINIIDRLVNYSNLDKLSSNMISYTLLALDSNNYQTDANDMWNRDNLIEKLLTFQNLENGGFGLSNNSTVSVDITAMTLQALAPYNTANYPEVQAAVLKALDYLKNEMTNDAGYFVEGDDNGCSAAQVLTALVLLDIDPLDPNNGFTKGNNNLVTKLNQFKLSEGFTTFKNSNVADGMATSQIGYALEAYRRYVNGENSLYDLSDVKLISQEEYDQLVANEVINLINQIQTVSLDSKDIIEKARKAYDALTENQKRLVTNYQVLLDAESKYASLISNQDNNTVINSNSLSKVPQTGDDKNIEAGLLLITLSMLITFSLKKRFN